MSEPALVLVAGGTTESRQVAEALVERGYRVLLSQATETSFPLKVHSRLRCRVGRLSAEGWEVLAREVGAVALVDAAHPHALELRETLRAVSIKLSLPRLRLRRADIELGDKATVVDSHLEAARLACQLGQRILVTVGTRKLSYYVEAAKLAQVTWFARILDNVESRQALALLLFTPDQVIFDRGPFSLAQNLAHLKQCAADVVVTKDSGREGGLLEKLEAAQRFGCQVVVVARPEEQVGASESVSALLTRLQELGL